jgi:hypothetical protein
MLNMQVKTRPIHVDSGAISVIIVTYGLSLGSAALLSGLNLIRTLLTTLLVAINLLSLVRVHLRLVSKPKPMDYALFVVNVVPYTYLLFPTPRPWLLLSLIPLLIFVIEALRGKGRGAVANIAGTALLSSTYLPWLAMMGITPSLTIIYAAIIWVGYHVFSAIYVEGKLPFRAIKPWFSSLWWLTLTSFLAYLTMSSKLYLAMMEPTARAVIALREGKINRNGLRENMRRIGIMSLIESIIMAVMLLLLIKY